MESFSVLSSGLSTSKRLLKTEKMPLLRNYALFPILLSPDRDPHLEKSTEGRVLASTTRWCLTTCAPSQSLRWRRRCSCSVSRPHL